jgi:hypothetical protein
MVPKEDIPRGQGFPRQETRTHRDETFVDKLGLSLQLKLYPAVTGVIQENTNFKQSRSNQAN